MQLKKREKYAAYFNDAFLLKCPWLKAATVRFPNVNSETSREFPSNRDSMLRRGYHKISGSTQYFACWRSVKFTRSAHGRASNTSGVPIRDPQTLAWRTAAVVGTFTAVAGFTFAKLRRGTLDRSLQTDFPDQSTCSVQDMPSVVHDVSRDNINAAKNEITSVIGADRVSEDVGSCISHSSTEWSSAPNGDLDRYSLIAYPSTTEEVRDIAKICYRRRIPMTAFSGGTSLEGTLAAVHGGLCMDFKFMNKVLAYHKDDLDVTVQPGLEHLDLNRMIATDGLFFPPDPGPGAKIGGMIGQGCSGTNAYRYGTMKDWVLGLTLVLADGTIVKTRHRPRKSSCGYDLT